MHADPEYGSCSSWLQNLGCDEAKRVIQVHDRCIGLKVRFQSMAMDDDLVDLREPRGILIDFPERVVEIDWSIDDGDGTCAE